MTACRRYHPAYVIKLFFTYHTWNDGSPEFVLHRRFLYDPDACDDGFNIAGKTQVAGIPFMRALHIHGDKVDKPLLKQRRKNIGTGTVGVELDVKPRSFYPSQEVRKTILNSRLSTGNANTIQQALARIQKGEEVFLPDKRLFRDPVFYQLGIVAIGTP